MIPPAVFNLISKTSLKMLALIFRVEEKKKITAFIIIIIMLIITFQALSCSLHFTINTSPRACLEIAVVTPSFLAFPVLLET